MTFIPEYRTLYAGAWSENLLDEVYDDTDPQELSDLAEAMVVIGLVLGWHIDEGNGYRAPVIAELNEYESDEPNGEYVFYADDGRRLSRSRGYLGARVGTDPTRLRNALRDEAWRSAEAKRRRLRKAAKAAS